MGFHGVQLFGLALIGYGISAATQGDYNGRIAALFGLGITFVGLFIDWYIDDRMRRFPRREAPAFQR